MKEFDYSVPPYSDLQMVILDKEYVYLSLFFDHRMDRWEMKVGFKYASAADALCDIRQRRIVDSF